MTHPSFSSLRTTGGLAIVLMSTSACFGPSADVEDPQDVTLDGAHAAAYISPPSRDIEDGSSTGHLALIDESGGTRLIETSGMDTAAIGWSSDGLFFSDTEQDYQLTDDGLRTTDSPKASAQHALFPTSDGGFIGLFNKGTRGVGYTEQLVTYADGTSSLANVEGYYHVSGSCDGEIYGLAPPSGDYEQMARDQGLELRGNLGSVSFMLTRLAGEDAMSSGMPEADAIGQDEQLVGMAAVSDSAQHDHDAPCREGTMHHLAVTDEDGASPELPVVLRSWDVSTGDVVETPLIDADGESLRPNSNAGISIVGSTALSDDGRSFLWASRDHQAFMRTDIATGTTVEEFPLDDEIVLRSSQVSAAVRDDRLAVITQTSHEDDPVLRIYDRHTGETLEHTALPKMTELLEGTVSLRGMALRPE